MKKTVKFLKRITILAAVGTLLGTPAFMGRSCAVADLFRDDAPFAQLIETARFYEAKQMSGEATNYYTKAAQKAQTDAERAQAYLGAANNTLIRYGRPDPATDGTLKINAYRKVLDLPAAPATIKAEAHLGIAQTQAELRQFDAALASLKQVSGMADATAAQKFKAQLWSGEILIEAKRYDEARTRLAGITKAPDAGITEKLVAHRAIARSYFRQINLTDGLAEIAKINALPGLKSEQRADIHIQNGDMLTEAGHHKAARVEYEKVAILAAAPSEKNVLAKFKIGESHFAERNYQAAREVWNQMLNMPGVEIFGHLVWKAIGLAYAEEKNYPKAREAYEKWLARPGLDIEGKVQAWQYVANSYVHEKNYQAAREALANISKLAPANADRWDKLQFKLRQQFDIAEVYRLEGDFVKAGETYTAILQDVPAGGAAEPPFYYEAREQVFNAAAAMAKDKASMAAAYTIFEALEKVYPYEKNDAEALLGMGDILLAQGKPTEAKAKYQKAFELRKNYDEGKIAQEKIRKIEGMEKSGAGS